MYKGNTIYTSHHQLQIQSLIVLFFCKNTYRCQTSEILILFPSNYSTVVFALFLCTENLVHLV